MWYGKKPAHDQAAKIDGVENEVDMFKLRSNMFTSFALSNRNSCTRSEEWTRNSAVSPEEAQAVSGKANTSLGPRTLATPRHQRFVSRDHTSL